MLNVTSKNNDSEELDVVEIIKTLEIKYKIPSFIKNVNVEKGATPHSHPVLTLNCRVDDERLLLQKLVHEQFHWYAQEHLKYSECLMYLKQKYVDDGEHNKSGTYPNSYWEHIIVCFNTRNYLATLLPKADLDWVYNQWQAYPTLEKFIATKFKEISTELRKFSIIYGD